MKQLRMARLQANIAAKSGFKTMSACRIDYLKARLERKRAENLGVLLNPVMYQPAPQLEAAE